MKLINAGFKREDERGSFIEMLNSPKKWHTISFGKMTAGAKLGNHYHKKCIVCFILTKGSAKVLIKNVREANSPVSEINLVAEQGILFDPYETHVIEHLEPSEFILAKSEEYKPDDPDTFTAKLL